MHGTAHAVATDHPPFSRFATASPTNVVMTAPEGSAALRNNQREERLEFDEILGPEACQKDTFDRVLAPMVEAASKQRTPGVAFAFGVTNSGKTHTMLGSKRQPGLLPRAIRALMGRAGSNDSVAWHGLRMSCVELYGREARDLLSASVAASQRKVTLREDPTGRIVPSGAVAVQLRSAKEGVRLAREASRRRSSAKTAMNAGSSRGHMLVTLSLVCGEQDGHESTRDPSSPEWYYLDATSWREDQARTWSEIHVVDLCGIERAAKSGARDTQCVPAPPTPSSFGSRVLRPKRRLTQEALCAPTGCGRQEISTAHCPPSTAACGTFARADAPPPSAQIQ